jgi:DNA-binding transcriptional LysR family regulator
MTRAPARPARPDRQVGLRALQGFAEIMRSGSGTAAGRVLGLSQPAISRMVVQLEQDIGFELFYRDKGRLVPTKEGLMLAQEVDLALAGVARVHALIDDIANNATGELRIIAPPSFAEGIMPGIISTFAQAFPGVRIAVDSRSIATTKTMLITRVADCAFMRMPINHEDLDAQVMVSSDSVCVMAIDHPLAVHEVITPHLLKNVPMIALGAGNTYGRQVDEVFRASGVQQRIAVECHTTSAACALAARGMGVTIVNELLANAYAGPHLVVRRFAPGLRHDYALVTSAKTRPSRLLEEFRSTVMRYFG